MHVPVVLLFLLLCSSIGFSQDSTKGDPFSQQLQSIFSEEVIRSNQSANSDSMYIKSLLDVSRSLIYENPDSAAKLATKAFQLSEKSQFYNGQSASLGLLGIAYTVMGDFEKAISYQELAAKVDLQTGNRISLAKTYGNLSSVYQYMGDYHKALEIQLQSISISEQLQDTLSMAISYNNLGNIHHRMGNFDRSNYYFKRAIRFGEGLVPIQEYIRFFNNRAMTLFKLDDVDSSLFYVEYALHRAEEESLSHIEAESRSIRGEIHFKMGEPELAVQAYQQTIPIFENSGDQYSLLALYLHLGEAHTFMGNTDSSKRYVRKVLRQGREHKVHLMEAYQEMTAAYLKEGKADSAKVYLDSTFMMRDRLFDSDRLMNSERLQIEFDTEKLKNELKQLELQTIISESTGEKQRLWLWLAVVFIILLIISVGLYLRLRRVNERQRLSELEQRALRAQMNPHFIFNSLNSIQRLYIEGETSKASDYMADFSQLMRKILDSTSKSEIRLSEEMEMLQLYCEIEQLRSGGMLQYLLEVEESIPLTETWVPPLIIQPFVENAVWHGILPKKEQGTVKVFLFKQGDKLSCVVEDDGVGFSTSTDRKNHDSKGIQLTEERIRNRVFIEHLDPGTRITFQIPFK